jgi:hypothetical protein
MKLILYPNLLNAPDCEKKWWAEKKRMKETKQQGGTDWYFIHGSSSVSAPQRSHLKMLFATHPSRVVIYAAITAAEIAGSVVGRPCSLPTLNWRFLILTASSIPLIVTVAVWKHL